MNYWAFKTSDKLHEPLFLIETPVYFLLIKISPSATKKDLPCIKETECDMDSRIKLKGFKKIVNEFRTKNMAERLFVENCIYEKIRFFI